MRLLPVLIGDKVQNHEDGVWQLALQLKDIVDLICAQNTFLSQIAYADILIQEYLELRKLFLEIQPKPKHHFLCQVMDASQRAPCGQFDIED